MNRWLLLVIALITLALLVNIYVPAKASHEQSAFSGLAKVTNRSEIGKCIAPDRLQICWNRKSVMQFETNDPRLTGEATLIFNSIFTKLPYAGRMWGNFHLVSDGGSWDGTWKGLIDTQGNTRFVGVGQGRESYKGMAIRWTMEPSRPGWLAEMSVNGSIIPVHSPSRKR